MDSKQVVHLARQNRECKLKESIMENFTITTLENGDVAVACQYYDWTSDSYVKTVERYTEIGRYVYRVCDNGSTAQICEGLRATGPTLMLSGSLEETISKALRS